MVVSCQRSISCRLPGSAFVKGFSPFISQVLVIKPIALCSLLIGLGLMLLAITPGRQLGAPGLCTRFFRFHWHCIFIPKKKRARRLFVLYFHIKKPPYRTVLQIQFSLLSYYHGQIEHGEQIRHPSKTCHASFSGCPVYCSRRYVPQLVPRLAPRYAARLLFALSSCHLCFRCIHGLPLKVQPVR